MNRWACASKVINFTSALALQIRNRQNNVCEQCDSQESKVTCITFFRRLCIKVRKAWDTTKPIPTPSRRPEMIPAAGTTHDLRVMLCAPRTQEKNKKTKKTRLRETLEDEWNLEHEAFTDTTTACESSAVSCFPRLKKKFPATGNNNNNRGKYLVCASRATSLMSVQQLGV